ncbi:MAG: DNA polymerase III subunit delta' [candidate division GAL15 bacterium]
MRFADVLDQHHAIGLLRSALRSGRVHHAYLFAGPAGTGRSETAAAFAQALQCERYHEDSCAVCEPCRKVSGGVHPDVRWVRPLEGKTAIGIDQVREVRREAAYGPHEGRWKVFVFCPADSMLAEAQNSLLKVLEEPPERVVFVLIVESAHALLPTVVSRCQMVRFNLVPISQIEHALRVQLGVEPARARVLAALSAGRAARAAGWSKDPAALEERDAVVDRLVRAEKEGLLAALEACEFLAQDRARLPDRLEVAALWYRDLLVWRETQDPALLVNADRKEQIAELAHTLDGGALRRRLQALEQARLAVRRNVTPRLALEAAFLRFHEDPASTRA